MRNFLKLLFLLVVIAGVTGVTSCVSPFYGTARIEPGWHMDVGVAGNTYLYTNYYASPYYKGIRSDLELRYGFNKYLQCNLRATFGWGFNGKIYRYGHEVEEEVGNYPFYDVTATGLTSLPFQEWNGAIALGIETGYGQEQFHACPIILLGSGNPEFFTLGMRLYGYYPGNLFVGIHVSRFHIFTGVDIWTLFNPDYGNIYPIATLGVGYKLK